MKGRVVFILKGNQSVSLNFKGNIFFQTSGTKHQTTYRYIPEDWNVFPAVFLQGRRLAFSVSWLMAVLLGSLHLVFLNCRVGFA
jgi:hypothetical protein